MALVVWATLGRIGLGFIAFLNPGSLSHHESLLAQGSSAINFAHVEPSA
jgi:hypothetical protein